MLMNRKRKEYILRRQKKSATVMMTACVNHHVDHWNEHEFIVGNALYQIVQPPASTYSYDTFNLDRSLLKHTSLANFTAELARNYAAQHALVSRWCAEFNITCNFPKAVQDVQDGQAQGGGIARAWLRIPLRMAPSVFTARLAQQLSTLVVHAGDIVDLEGYRGTGTYLVYAHLLTQQLYVRKTLGDYGCILPFEAWPILALHGIKYFRDTDMQAIQLPFDLVKRNRKAIEKFAPQHRNNIPYGLITLWWSEPVDDHEDNHDNDNGISRVETTETNTKKTSTKDAAAAAEAVCSVMDGGEKLGNGDKSQGERDAVEEKEKEKEEKEGRLCLVLDGKVYFGELDFQRHRSM